MTTTKDEIEKFRKKFGQFYVSIKPDNTPSIIDLEGVIEVTSRDTGEKLRVIASGDIEKFILSLSTHIRSEMVEELEGMKKKPTFKNEHLRDTGRRLFAEEYNQAIQDMIDLLSKD